MCYKPISLKHLDGTLVPCGKCPKCKGRRVSSWSFRLMQHSKDCVSAHFITLTYDTKHVPITKNGFLSVYKKDLQLFFKRLRKANKSGKNISYYAAAEYGGKTNRPHYHIILFNADIELIQKAWINTKGRNEGLSHNLRPFTNSKEEYMGRVHYGTLSYPSVGYTLKYINKDKYRPLHSRDDRLPPFALMSKE